MKIAIVGGGSTYCPELAHGLFERASALGLDTLALYDIAEERLDTVGGFVRRMGEASGVGTRVEIHGDLDPTLADADFVVVQIRVGGQAARLEDEKLGKTHAIIGQETTGVGGLAKALRTIPALLRIAERTTAVAPDATLINFTNPVSIVTEALIRHAGTKTIGLCNIPISQRMEIAAQLGVPATDVEIDSVGLNHLSFIRGVKVAGEEALPRLIEDVSKIVRSGNKPANIPDLDFPAELIESLQMIPSDYLRYYFMATETIDEQQKKEELRATEVMKIEAELMTYYADPKNDQKPASLSKRGGAFYSHAALEIIEASQTPGGRRLIVDTKNGSCLGELPEDACVEVPCRVGPQGAEPLPQRPLEPQIRGLIQHVKAYEELAVKAALTTERRDVYLAVLSHPLVPSGDLASRITDQLMQRI